MKEFKNKNILIFGGSGGIGLALSQIMYKFGANIYIVSKDINKKNNLQSLMPKAILLYEDLSTKNGQKNCVVKIKILINKIDYLVFSLGEFEESNIHSINPNKLNSTLELNLYSHIFLVQGLLSLIKKGEGRSIVFLSSILGIYVDHDTLTYSLSKSALISLTKSLAIELAKDKIRVNSISPSFVDTDMIKNHMKNDIIKNNIIEKHPFGRIGNPTDIANSIVFFLSGYSSWITGQNLILDGGRSLIPK